MLETPTSFHVIQNQLQFLGIKMPASLNQDDKSYQEFGNGAAASISPLSDHDQQIIRFSARKFRDAASRDAAINQQFGLSSMDYFRRLESIKDHPYLGDKDKKRLEETFTTQGLGPMKGGATMLDDRQFSHGVNW